MSDESWSWKKFFKGFVDGRNYAKSIVLLFCSAVIFTVCFSVYTVIKNRFIKKPEAPIQTEIVGTNQGTINKQDSHDSVEKRGWQLFGGLIQINNEAKK